MEYMQKKQCQIGCLMKWNITGSQSQKIEQEVTALRKGAVILFSFM
jgi:hypothetical protein